jgi:hypothetical protein
MAKCRNCGSTDVTLTPVRNQPGKEYADALIAGDSYVGPQIGAHFFRWCLRH